MELLADGATQDALRCIYPSGVLNERRDQKLKGQFSVLRSRFKIVKDNYSRSGQGYPDLFPNFCAGRTWVMYALCVIKAHPFIDDFTMKFVSTIAQIEFGLDVHSSPSDPVDTSSARWTPKRLKYRSATPQSQFQL